MQTFTGDKALGTEAKLQRTAHHTNVHCTSIIHSTFMLQVHYTLAITSLYKHLFNIQSLHVYMQKITKHTNLQVTLSNSFDLWAEFWFRSESAARNSGSYNRLQLCQGRHTPKARKSILSGSLTYSRKNKSKLWSHFKSSVSA